MEKCAFSGTRHQKRPSGLSGTVALASWSDLTMPEVEPEPTTDHSQGVGGRSSGIL